MPDGIPSVHLDDAAAAAAASGRKNSILVKDDKDASRVNLQAAHPHFVEQAMPHRSPPTSIGSNPSVPAAQTVPEQLSRLHFGGSADAGAKTTPGSPPLMPQTSRGAQPPIVSQPQAQAVAHAQAQAEAQEEAMAQAKKAQQQQLPQQQQNYQTLPFPQQQQQQQQPQQQQPQFYSQHHHPDSSGGSRSTQTSPLTSHPQVTLPHSQPAAFGPVRADLYGAGSTVSVPSTSSVPPGIQRVNSPGVLSSDGEAGAVGGRSTSKQPSDPRIPMNDGKIHILIGLTGSLHISSIKSMISKLQSIYGDRVAIQVILTPAAEKLVASARAGGESTGPAPTPHPLREREHHSNVQIWHDNDEWDTWRGRNDPVIHIELRRWADILVVAPLSANTLGKIAMGLCDNLLTNVIRAWNSQYPILIAPAMVSYAYNHPATKHHLKVIKEEMKWIEILRPTEKVAGSTGGIGMGGMMPWNEIVDRIVHKLGGYPDEEDDDEDDDRDEQERQPNDFEDDDDDDDDAGDILTEGFDSGASADVPRASPI